MKVLKLIIKIAPRQLVELLALSLKHLLFIWPTYKATKLCLQISTKYFGRKHYRNGTANAFRHALWNALIAIKCQRVTKHKEKVVFWTKAITNWHEATFFNQPLAMHMDYHNNDVGLQWFINNPKTGIDQSINYLLNLTTKAVKIKEIAALKSFKNQLVYITDDH